MQRWVEAAREGSIRAASRLISLLENDPTRLPALFQGLSSWPEPRLIVGITGPPGVGKSTLVDGMLACWRRREPEQRIGVLAVDPSSPFTGGAILGDRIRMMSHATDPQVFIRSMASRGHLGGLTLGIRGALRVMGLVGCGVVIVETVGIGQSEIEVAGVADMTVVVLAPGQGDGVQMLKAGLMEAADLFVVNKADRPGADRMVADLRATMTLSGNPRGAEVLATAATGRGGVDELVDAIEARGLRLRDDIGRHRARAVVDEVRAAVVETARRRLEQVMSDGTIEAVLRGESTIDDATSALMRQAVGVGDEHDD